MQEGDTIRVTQQPPGNVPPIEGRGGFIDEIREDSVYVQLLTGAGVVTGGGWIPTRCVEVDHSPSLSTAKANYDRLTEARAVANMRWTELVSAARERTAERCGIDRSKVDEILRVYSEEVPEEG